MKIKYLIVSLSLLLSITCNHSISSASNDKSHLAESVVGTKPADTSHNKPTNNNEQITSTADEEVAVAEKKFELPKGPLYSKLISTTEQSETSQDIIHLLQTNHFRHMYLDDELSAKVLDEYINILDSNKIHFHQADINEFEAYRKQLDDALKEGNLKPAFLIFNRYQQRLSERIIYSLDKLENDFGKFNFTIDENITIDRENDPWAKDSNELKNIWRKYLKQSILNLKMADDQVDDIQKTLKIRYINYARRLKQNTIGDAFDLYMNAVASIFDPHTRYFSPHESDNFHISMGRSLEGIGAQLTTENEYIKVVKLITGGPAEKSGELHAGDRIVGVDQHNDGSLTDIIGWRIEEAVQLIRGKKDSVVRLQIISNDNNTSLKRSVINITRDKVILEDQAAKSDIINIKRANKHYKIGVIDLPLFYADLRGSGAATSTTNDVKNILKELKLQNVDGIVMDLRDNSGGSLREANDLVGLFIKSGPTVQIKDMKNRVYPQGDPNPAITYSGPLTVLVNRMSASASEIFAGAIQDYKRGLVVGGQTYGKGTVQTLLPIGKGHLKLTHAKYYRISGNSTQHRGVIPDIQLPTIYDNEEFGEKTLGDYVLPWDTISSARHHTYFNINQSMLTNITKQHQERIKKDPEFNYIQERLDYFNSSKHKNTLFLQEEKALKEREETENWRLNLENKRLVAKGEEPVKNLDELNKKKHNDDENDKSKKDDAILNETANITVDFIIKLITNKYLVIN